MQNFFENDFFTLAFHSNANAIYLKWLKAPSTPDDYKSAFIKGSEALQKYGASAWLADVTNQGAVLPENRQWLEIEILPKSVGLGLRKIAIIVMNEDVFRKYYLEQLKRSTENEGILGMRYFQTMEDAVQWLK